MKLRKFWSVGGWGGGGVQRGAPGSATGIGKILAKIWGNYIYLVQKLQKGRP